MISTMARQIYETRNNNGFEGDGVDAYDALNDDDNDDSFDDDDKGRMRGIP